MCPAPTSQSRSTPSNPYVFMNSMTPLMKACRLPELPAMLLNACLVGLAGDGNGS